MFKRALCLLTLSLLTVTIMAFAKEASKPKAETAIYTEENTNFSMSASQPTFIIKLKSNPTTGYSWFLREYDDSLITPVKHSFEKASNTNLMGAPGYELWTFTIKPAGFAVPQQTLLRFVYTRPWQGNDGSTQVVFRISTQSK